MSTTTQFHPGPDTRRPVGKRTPTPASFRRKVLGKLAGDLDGTLDRLGTLARAGDPDAVIAVGQLLAVALAIPAPAKASTRGATGE